eukprot:TRINITY_DN26480_c0_g1_i1.p1 TRINITY_DN26480_c0_g1~~TRINITY_DN26480_c0_g1_i1.p1  ORF type:complete len:319 (-),score=76.69 TRINITY_DN26480_c0_g1_i1:27-983(-)
MSLTVANVQDLPFDAGCISPPPGLGETFPEVSPPPGLGVTFPEVLKVTSSFDAGLVEKDSKALLEDASTCISGSFSEDQSSLLGTAEETERLLVDLQIFKMSLITGITSVRDSFSSCDEDLATALGHALVEAQELMELAESAATAVTATDLNMMLANMPTQLLVTGHPDPEMCLADGETRVAALKKILREVRINYVLLLERLKYFESCAEVSLAQVAPSDLEPDSETSSGRGAPKYIMPSELLSFQEQKGEASAESPRALSTFESLEVAIGRLGGVILRQEELSDFWLALHSAELDLNSIEEGMRCLALSSVAGGLLA